MSIPRPEYPRPQFVRNSWQNLNGKWDFLFDFGNSGVERQFFLDEIFSAQHPQDIVVPYCPESQLSGIGHTDFIPAVWYRRTFTLQPQQLDGRVLLHFGAVDYHAIVYVNGKQVGDHVGGYASFTLDITRAVNTGENHLVVYAEDDLRSFKQPFGKQCPDYQSRVCSYTRTTGIWQTVWLEFVPKEYLSYIKITPFVDDKRAVIDVETVGGKVVTATASFNGKVVGRTHASVTGNKASLVLPLSELHLWDIGQGNLYDLTVLLDDTDTVTSYFGMRKIELKSDALWLNDRPVFMRLILDQGFHPQGVYTAACDDDLKRDIERMQDLGFNGARFHQRVFEERSLYWADKLGYLVWGEYANGIPLNDVGIVGKFLPEWMDTVRRDYSHPSIIGWCPENESYWQKDNDPLCQTLYYDVTKQIDPYRPVIDASGGVHWKTDMFDVHEYEQNPDTLREKLAPMTEDAAAFHNPLHHNQLGKHVYEGQPYWISEYGGTFWNPDATDNGWGYGDNPKTEEEFLKRYAGLTTVLLQHPRVCGFCYTQLTDVEQEQNGLFKYDRSRKFSDAIYDGIRAANTQPAAIET